MSLVVSYLLYIWFTTEVTTDIRLFAKGVFIYVLIFRYKVLEYILMELEDGS